MPHDGDGDGAGSPFTAPYETKKNRFFLSPELFIYPMVLVGICVLVFFFFGEIGGDRRTVAQLIGDIRPRGVLDLQGPRRAAKELADRIQEMERQGRKLDEAETRQLIEVLDGLKSDAAVRQYAVSALGRAGREDLAFPVLVNILLDAGSAPLARVEAIRGLGLSRAPAAVPPLLQALEASRAGDDGEVRLNILCALTNIAGLFDGDPAGATLSGRQGVSEELRGSVAEVLRRHAGDPDAMVAVNVAMWLAEKFRDPSQVDTLRCLLDWTYLQSRGFSAEAQPILLCRAMECLVKLNDLDSLPVIRRLAADNRNYKVKNTALRALRDGFGGARAARTGDSRFAGTATGPAKPSPVKTVSR